MSGSPVLSGASDIIRCLVTYTDWWQPSSSSLYRIAGTGDRNHGDGLRGGLLDHLDERSELCRRMTELDDRDRRLLVLWYVKELPVEEIAPLLGISRRQVFRRRARAVRKLVEAGDSPRAA